MSGAMSGHHAAGESGSENTMTDTETGAPAGSLGRSVRRKEDQPARHRARAIRLRPGAAADAARGLPAQPARPRPHHLGRRRGGPRGRAPGVHRRGLRAHRAARAVRAAVLRRDRPARAGPREGPLRRGAGGRCRRRRTATGPRTGSSWSTSSTSPLPATVRAWDEPREPVHAEAPDNVLLERTFDAGSVEEAFGESALVSGARADHQPPRRQPDGVPGGRRALGRGGRQAHVLVGHADAAHRPQHGRRADGPGRGQGPGDRPRRRRRVRREGRALPGGPRAVPDGARDARRAAQVGGGPGRAPARRHARPRPPVPGRRRVSRATGRCSRCRPT